MIPGVVFDNMLNERLSNDFEKLYSILFLTSTSKSHRQEHKSFTVHQELFIGSSLSILVSAWFKVITPILERLGHSFFNVSKHMSMLLLKCLCHNQTVGYGDVILNFGSSQRANSMATSRMNHVPCGPFPPFITI